MNTKSTYKHLNEGQRRAISEMLDNSYSLKIIAETLDKHPSSISREIKNNRKLNPVRKNAKNKCGLFNECIVKHLCDACANGHCKFCSHLHCDSKCKEFSPIPNCKKLKRYPFVCNSCSEDKNCLLPRYYYNYKTAQIIRDNNVREHKFGIKVSDEELTKIDELLTKGIKNKHSVSVIVNTKDIDRSVSSIYSDIKAKRFLVDLMDLKKVVSRRAYTKKVISKNQNTDKSYRLDRTFDDYLEHVNNNDIKNIWEMDTVLGAKNGSNVCLLTLLHRESNLQMYFRLESCSQTEVSRVFDLIKYHLGEESFSKSFELILTDNGVEFQDRIKLSYDTFGQRELIKIFYCDPRRSDQKGKCEKNHEQFREIVPKGLDLKSYSTNDINYVSNQINNYPRRIFNYRTPIQMFEKCNLDKKILELNNLHQLNIDEVSLNRIIK
jgi:IS30 family transposase